MLYIDVTYANRLSPYLKNFKKKGEYTWNFSCPVCGDSKKSKTKARGNIYRSAKAGLMMKCFNCGHSTTLGNFIKQVDQTLYQEYRLEKYKSESGIKESLPVDELFKPEVKETLLTDEVLSGIKCVTSLKPSHPARKYLEDRLIPKDKHNLFYFCPKFKSWTNTIKKTYSNLEEDHPRLIIPYFTRHGKVFMYSGRAFGKEEPKYYHIKLDDSHDRIYGLDRVDFSKRIYVTEGQIDSLFLPNGVAVSGSSYDTATLRSVITNCTIVPDNERRSKEISKIILSTIEKGYSVCLWPDTITTKDINELILTGYTQEEVKKIIDENTFTGIEAKLRFSYWTKTDIKVV